MNLHPNPHALLGLVVLTLPIAALHGISAPAVAQVPQALAPAYKLYTYDRTAPASIRPDSGGNWQEDANDATGEENNPWLHVRLTALVTPQGSSNLPPFIVPGYYLGSKSSLGSGNDWRVRLRSPELDGQAIVSFYFEEGTNINVADPPTVAQLASMTPHSTEIIQSGGVQPVDPSLQSRGFVLPFYESGALGCRYWRYSNGDIWIKGGIDSPENFLAFDEFQDYTDPVIANVAAANDPGGEGLAPELWLHEYANHVVDWMPGDPTWTTTGPGGSTGHGKGIIGALNWLSLNGANSIYLLPMNLGGDGRDVSPFVDTPAVAGEGAQGIAPYDNVPLVNGFDDSRLNYRVKRLNQWDLVFRHANKKGLFLNVVLGETEDGNTNWLDDGTTVMSVQRKLFLKNMVAMFGHNLALKWNLWEETPIGASNDEIHPDDVTDMGLWIKSWDFVDWDPVRMSWIGHGISTHGYPNNSRSTPTGWWFLYRWLRDNVADADWVLDATSMQIHGGESGSHGNTDASDYGWYVEQVRTDFLAGDQSSGNAGSSPRYVLLDVDEQGSPGNGLKSDLNGGGNADATAEDRRKRILFDTLFSGASGIEWYCGYYPSQVGGGDVRLEDFRTRADLLATTKTVVDFLTDSIHGQLGADLFQFEAADSLVSGEYIHPVFGEAEVFAQPEVCYLIYYPGLGSNGGAGTVTVDHGPTLKSGGMLWYRAEDMSLVPSATQTFPLATGVQSYLPVPPAGADDTTDFVLRIYLR